MSNATGLEQESDVPSDSTPREVGSEESGIDPAVSEGSDQAPHSDEEIERTPHHTGKQWRRFSWWRSRVSEARTKVGLVAIVGLALSVFGLGFDVISSSGSTSATRNLSAQQDQIGELVNSMPVDVAAKVAEIIDLDEALREEGPIRDLAELARSEEPEKAEASEKVYSGDDALELEGARQLLEFARRRSASVTELGRVAAADFRQAGAAFLVAGDPVAALEAYQNSLEHDSTNLAGYRTVSELALQLGNIELAENAALNGLESGDFEDNWGRRFGLEQIVQVYLRTSRPSKAERYLIELEPIVRDRFADLREDRNRFGDLSEQGVERLLAIGGNPDQTQTQIFYDGMMVASYGFTEIGIANIDNAMDALVADTLLIISRFQLLNYLEQRADYFTQIGDVPSALVTLEEASDLALQQRADLSMLGRSVVAEPFYRRKIDLQTKANDKRAALQALADLVGLYEEDDFELRRVASEYADKDVTVHINDLTSKLPGPRINESSFELAMNDSLNKLNNTRLEMAMIHFELEEYPSALSIGYDIVERLEAVNPGARDQEFERIAATAYFYLGLFQLMDQRPSAEWCASFRETDRRAVADPSILGGQPEQVATGEDEIRAALDDFLTDCPV